MNLALALLSAALLILTFPKFDIAWLAPAALAPLLFAAAREPRPLRRFWLGWAAGAVYWFGVCYWIQFVLAVHGGMGELAAWGTFLLFSLAKGLHLAVFALLAGVLMRSRWAIPSTAALWTAIEATHGSFGFAWLALGNAGIEMGLPVRLAPLTGVGGLSFAFAMMAAAVALTLLRRPRMQLLWLAALLLLPLLPHLPDAERGREAAVLLQPNISQDEQWTRESLDERVRRMTLASMGSALSTTREKPALIVWPEVPAPFYYEEDREFRQAVNELARITKTWVLPGVVTHTPSGAPLNSALLVSPEGVPVARYDKVNLVPFGEFVPWPFGWVNRISKEVGDFAAGDKVVVSQAGAHRIGTFICYESVFPDFVRRFPAQGAEVLFNISNDGYFGKSAAREQHLKIVRMRAAENRRWILRATNDGITAGIDSAGRVRGLVQPYLETAAYMRFNYESRLTPYTQWGEWFPLACGAVSAGLLLLPRLKSLR